MSDGPAVRVAGPGGSSGLEFIIAGHSHVFAMGASIRYAGPIAPVPFELDGCRGYFLEEEWATGDRTTQYWDALVEHAKGRVAVLVFGGSLHFIKFQLACTPPFDFVDPTDPDHRLYPGAVLVPRRMVKASLASGAGGLRRLIPRIRTGGCRCVIVAGTPPVRGDLADATDHVRNNPRWHRSAEKMGIDLATLSLTPAPIMQRLWGVLQETMADAARAGGARFLPVPREVFDADGYLAPAYRWPGHDYIHANHAYGRLMLEHIVRAVKQIAAEAASAPCRPAA